MTRPIRTQTIFLFLDYDGTLVPIKKRPELALLPPSKRKILEDLNKKYFLAIVTGRALKEIKRLVRIKKAAYIGNHGLEISFQGKNWVHPKTEKISFSLKKTLKRIKSKIKSLHGAWVEDKGLTASVHYRAMRKIHKPVLIKTITAEIAASKGLLKWTEGKMVIEIHPNIDWDKGRGIKKLLQWVAGSVAIGVKIYIGDDNTDEDAFKALNKNGVTILVGPERKTHASHIFKDVHTVWKFLKQLDQSETNKLHKFENIFNSLNRK